MSWLEKIIADIEYEKFKVSTRGNVIRLDFSQPVNEWDNGQFWLEFHVEPGCVTILDSTWGEETIDIETTVSEITAALASAKS